MTFYKTKYKNLSDNFKYFLAYWCFRHDRNNLNISKQIYCWKILF